MTVQAETRSEHVGQPGFTSKPATVATHLIASCARSTGASALFCIWNAAKMLLAAQEGKHAL